MGKIHIVTDSGSDLPLEIREQFGISVVPLTVQFGDEIYRDGEEISTSEFFSKLESSQTMPSTCQPSPADFLKIYERIAAPGDTIVSIHLSSKMSGTYQSAVLGGSMLDTGITVKTVDTRNASMGIGLVALAAAEAVQAGKSLDEVLAVAQHAIDQQQVYFVVDTLEYLKKNGRIALASALVGTLLNIKPVLTLIDGQVAPFEKIRGKAKALKRLRELVEDMRNENPDHKFRVALSNSECREDAERLAEQLQKELPIVGDVVIGQIGPTIGVHTGPGTVALFLYPVAE